MSEDYCDFFYNYEKERDYYPCELGVRALCHLCPYKDCEFRVVKEKPASESTKNAALAENGKA